MKIKLIVVGKTNAKYLLEGEREYENRLNHYTKFEEIIIPDVKHSGKLSENEFKKKDNCYKIITPVYKLSPMNIHNPSVVKTLLTFVCICILNETDIMQQILK